VAGRDGALWFTEPGINAIGRIITAGVISEFAILTVDPDDPLWFTEQPDRIGRIAVTRNGRCR
jgi:virginiamycin B lyase